MLVRERSHRSLTDRLTDTILGPDHQRIAKLDRENEVAPPAKVNASVGKVSVPLLSCILSKAAHATYVP